MNRREFLGFTGLLASAGFTSLASANEVLNQQESSDFSGVASDYFEFRIAGPEIKNMMHELKLLESKLKENSGFLSLSLKQMVGDSTMVKNYPSDLKGVLSSAYEDGAKEGSLPFFYSLFVRFESQKQLQKAQIVNWFNNNIQPLMHAYKPTKNGPVKTPIAMAYYHGVFQTILVGNRKGIYAEQNDIKNFLKSAQDSPEENRITVANHVMIHDKNLDAFEKRVTPLLKVAQQTFQPKDDVNQLGLAATKDNNYYRKAMTTEIMRKAIPDGDLRAYLMHGVWESVLDHENSHLDRRFKESAGPVGAMVAVGPVEPFYKTRYLGKA
ncbi:hypothetical protein [Thiomicrorhabdus sp. Milos-T2]|uniref:hypothetical protein n=1 Tax=Thiomicrorhabdus sp. Milos-T2 TaxID=90814 RepID=UPI000494CD6E|nr:hypothetical protein [Thiomicrorhabdus sp. Milos-T2]